MKILSRIAVLGAALILAGCSSAATPAPSAAPPSAASAAPSAVAPSASASTSASASASAAASASALDCSRPSLKTMTPGTLTIGADNPAYGPWFAGPAPAAGSVWQNADPNNGLGLEAATAYLIAQELGFPKADVVWTAVPFANAIQPGPKKFDIYLTQVSYTPERAQAVDLSDGYFNDNQAVVGFKSNAISKVTTVAGLKAFRLGTQVGTTSLTYIQNNIQPTKAPLVYNTLDAAVAALKAHQIDGVVVDLGTAYFVRDVELTNGSIVGELPTVGAQEHFSVVLNKGSSLTACVNQAIAALTANGDLESLRQEYIVKAEGDVPMLK
ncbi:MAG: ABC transporter substrate-binding protein [Candidatus Limnocylindrales bacterium]